MLKGGREGGGGGVACTVDLRLVTVMSTSYLPKSRTFTLFVSFISVLTHSRIRKRIFFCDQHDFLLRRLCFQKVTREFSAVGI